MRETLKLVNNEKDEASRQYQNYVRQLDTQQAKLLNEVHINVNIIPFIKAVILRREIPG